MLGSRGLYDVSLANILCYPDESHKDFIQFLNVRHSHWVCVSNKSCNAGIIKIYDSLRTSDQPLSTKEVISALLHYQKKKVTLIFPDVQKQSGGSACYVFTLVYTYTLCQGEDPIEVQYSVPKIRPHFLSCLQKKKFTEFTVFLSVKTRHTLCKAIMTSFKIYCVCRLPERQGDKMVACDKCQEWCHFVCVRITSDKELDDTWLCCKCIS